MANKLFPSPQARVVNDQGQVVDPWYGYLRFADSRWRNPVTVISSTIRAVVPNTGITRIQTTQSSTHTLGLPDAGCRAVITLDSATTSCRLVSASTSVKILPGTGWALNFTSSAANKRVVLEGLSDSEWLIVSNPNAATVST